MSATAATCSHCGIPAVALKRCMRCRQASYCGVECQRAAWAVHKKTCTPMALPSDAPRVPAFALWNAAVYGRFEEVRQLLADGAIIEEKGGERGCGPLHAAAQGGHMDVARLLLAGGLLFRPRTPMEVSLFTTLHMLVARCRPSTLNPKP